LAKRQSRATDTHLILRPHEEDGAVVLDAAVRSWPPVSPMCLRWEYPIWRPAPDLDPTQLRKPNRRKPQADEAPAKPTEPPWDAKRFANAFGSAEPKPRSVMLEEASRIGLSDRKAESLLKAALDRDLLFAWGKGRARTLISTVRPELPRAET
jgi:hypothetical protein